MPTLITNFAFAPPPPPPPPTLVRHDANAALILNGTSVYSDIAYTWVAGDIIIIRGTCEDNSFTLSPVNGSNLTFTPVSAANAAGSSCWGRAWYAIATGPGSAQMELAGTTGSGSKICHIQSEHWRDTAGIGNTVGAAVTFTTPTQTMTVSAYSAVSTGWADFNAGTAGVTAETNTGTITEIEDQQYGDPSISCWYAAWVGVAAGSDGWGSGSGSGAGRQLTFPGTIEILAVT